MTATTEKSATGEPTRRAGAFDIRVFIALLIGIYGLVLVVAGIIGPSDSQLKKADGLNINLFAGIGMVLVSAAFLLWARLRPVVVPVHAEDADGDDDAGGAAEGDRPQGH